jgi:hypothetical protein
MLALRPNCECCDRDLTPRPVRPGAHLARFPASTQRVRGTHAACRR